MRKLRHRGLCPRSPSHKVLKQYCPRELSVMPEVLYIGTAQQDSPWLHVARVIKKLILYFISFYTC